MEIIYFIIVGGLALLFFYSQSSITTMSYKPKACKPHVWRYKDAQGWLDLHTEDDARIRHAYLYCVQCNKPPSQDSGSKNGEYE